MTDNTTLVQGESLATDYNGSVQVVLSTITMQLGKNTQLDFLSALHEALVFRQPQGKVTYIVDQDIKPFSIRSLALLAQFEASAKVTIQTDNDNQTVTLHVLSGEAIVAYSDNQNNTQVKKLVKGDIATFDNAASILMVE